MVFWVFGLRKSSDFARVSPIFDGFGWFFGFSGSGVVKIEETEAGQIALVGVVSTARARGFWWKSNGNARERDPEPSGLICAQFLSGEIRVLCL